MKIDVINTYIHIISFILKFKKINGGYYSMLIARITLFGFTLKCDL